MDFLIGKIKEREFQKYFCRSLPYFYTQPIRYSGYARLRTVQCTQCVKMLIAKMDEIGTTYYIYYVM